MYELRAQMFDKKPGDRVRVSVRRENLTGADKDMDFEVTLR